MSIESYFFKMRDESVKNLIHERSSVNVNYSKATVIKSSSF